MAIHCDTSHAVVLVGARFERGLLRFFDCGNPEIPGVVVQINPKDKVEIQLSRAIRTLIPTVSKIHIFDSFAEHLEGASEPSTLFLAQVVDNDEVSAADLKSWRTMPDILGKMAKNRCRLGYLKAWQIFSGAAEESITAIKLGDLEKLLKE